MNHRILEWFEEVLLELEVGHLLFLQEPHRQLTKGVEREEADVGVAMRADLDKPLRQYRV